MSINKSTIFISLKPQKRHHTTKTPSVLIMSAHLYTCFLVPLDSLVRNSTFSGFRSLAHTHNLRLFHLSSMSIHFPGSHRILFFILSNNVVYITHSFTYCLALRLSPFGNCEFYSKLISIFYMLISFSV